MAASFKKTTIKSFPKVGEKVTRDTLYWKHLEFPVTKKENGAVSHIEFSPVEPFNYAVTSSVRVQLHSCRSHEVLKSFSRFREVAHSGSFRSDGKLLVAGSDEGIVRLFDLSSKTLLRMFRGHSGPVHVTKFLYDNTRVLSGSDDKTIRIWDIPSQTELCKFSEQSDYVRCAVSSQTSKDIVIAGCYDHKVRVYDVRSQEAVMTWDHGHPVESVLTFPAGGLVFSAGGNCIKVWDMLAGGRLITTLSHHHKTVMSLGFCSNYGRLISASLDRHVKIYDVGTYNVVHTLDYPSAILSAAVSPDDSLIAVGMTDGLLSLQRRRDTEDIVAEKLEAKRQQKISYKSRLMIKTHTPMEGDHVVEHRKKARMEKYDQYLKSFQHSKALDCVMELRVRTKTPEVTVSLMQELLRRNALRASLAGRDEKSITAVLKFLQKNLSNPAYMETLAEVVNIVLDLYGKDVAQSSPLESVIRNLSTTVGQELTYMKDLMTTIGTLDCLFANTQYANASQHKSASMAVSAEVISTELTTPDIEMVEVPSPKKTPKSKRKSKTDS